MARIVHDRSRCTGVGLCESVAEEYFELDDDGELHVRAGEVPDGDLAQVRLAVESCPNQALRLVSDAGATGG